MGEERSGVLDEVIEAEVVADAVTPAPPEPDAGVAAPRPPRFSRRTVAIAISTIAALVIAGGVVGGIVRAGQLAHDDALAQAVAAHAVAASAVDGQHAAVAGLEDAVARGIGARDAAAEKVLAHVDLLGGAEALAEVNAAQAALIAGLSEVLGFDEATLDTVIPDADAAATVAAVDRRASTERLIALAAEFTTAAGAADDSGTALSARTSGLDALIASLRASIVKLAATIPAVHETLLTSRTLAKDDAKTAAADAVAALGAADADTDLPTLLAAYATAASGVIASHDAEAARIAAEEAAKAAASRKWSGGSGGGSGGTAGCGGGGGGGVLGYTNAARAANCLPALAGSGTLNSMSCDWANQLAAADAGLSHNNVRPPGAGIWGENVASGYGSASAVVNGWMNSSGHRANILNSSFTQMGSCSAVAASGTTYWVQKFAG